MDIVVDSHTHTIASGHAYSTILENALAAKNKGLKLLCTTDHAPEMPGAPHYWHFNNQRILPRFLHEVGILRGVEANTLNVKGEIDLPPSSDQHLDWVIASFHEPVFRPATEAEHTDALINVIKSGRVDVLGHLGNPNYPFYMEQVLRCAKSHNVAIEVNNTSLTGKSRKGSDARCDQIVALGKEIGVYFSTGSDAHFCEEISKLDLAIELLEKHGVEKDKILTTSTRRFLKFLLLRGKPRIPEFDVFY
ncbi:phosphatase [Vibrio parahaemolyticus]|uniref:phosphatase n=1 Tax=Vibrio parahaemolyticus TaxID=670 RepID=UPI00084ACABB|nr:phosphatase [Vibrio parahaemolyticus]EGQ7846087.1 phosphatase [Vibrio parahaemolyticus]EGQ7850422.1 phosphatase [Vibrio parahaemolyticus]EID0723432.1 phosphatase [Vibrio parahaemolyticus]EJC7015985.1 phosphatase [Vibrio parahaemolyticus]EJC7018719.1 phosphatase [Vibrio parahaemolyticus]